MLIYRIKEIQISENVNKCAEVNSSPNRNTPINSIIVGAIYCKKPTIDNGMNWTELPKSNNGTAVAIPEIINNPFVPADPLTNPKLTPYIESK